MKTRWILLTVLLALALASCAPSQTDLPDLPSASPTKEPLTTLIPAQPTHEIATPDRINITMTTLPERVPPTERVSPVTGEVPSELLNEIQTDLAKRNGVSLEKIAVIQAQATIWNDGSLGCAKPGEFYTQARVNGYWVILEVGNQKYDYRVADTGYFFLCEGDFPPNPPSTPNS